MTLAALLFAPLIFISYARADRGPAIAIHKKLDNAGCIVWSDNVLQPGDRWELAIERNIDRSDIFLFLVGTPCNICRSEVHRAHRKGKWIIPVMLRPDADIPLLLEQYQWLEEDKIASLCTSASEEKDQQ